MQPNQGARSHTLGRPHPRLANRRRSHGRPQPAPMSQQIISFRLVEAFEPTIGSLSRKAVASCNQTRGHGATPWPATATPGQPETRHGRPQPAPVSWGRSMAGRGRLSGHKPAATATRGVRLDDLKTAQNHAQCNGRTLVSQQPRRTSSPQYT